MNCCFCGKEIKGYGNNPRPAKLAGECCDECNYKIVIPARMKRIVEGDKIRIVEMKDEPQYNGKTGTVEHIDDAGQIHGTWGGCAVIPDVDKIEIINETVCPVCGEKMDESYLGKQYCEKCNQKLKGESQDERNEF